jgi:hypothetical protein
VRERDGVRPGAVPEADRGGHALRLISTVLAVWMLRLARFDLARSERLHLDGDEAFGRSRERVRQAEALAARRCACASARK